MGLLTRMGVGAAEVDAILETETVQPGDEIPAHIEIEGGDEAQEIDEVELALQVRYQVHDGDDFSYETKSIVEREVDGFTIHEDEERTIELDPIEVPLNTPPTMSQSEVWVKTRLDIDWAKDPTDRDELTVNPGHYLDALISAIEDLGFELDFADNGPSELGPYDEFAFFLEYEDRGGTQWHNLDDLEFFVARDGDALDVGMEIETTSTKNWTEFTVEVPDAAAVQSQVERVVDENS